MSTALVRKALEICDQDLFKKPSGKKQKVNVFTLIPRNQKITKEIQLKGRKKENVALLSTNKKLTVIEAKKTIKSKDEILKKNKLKLRKLKTLCTIDLDKQSLRQIIDRAVTKRPVKPRQKSTKKKKQKTAFTEEDFKKFEEEYKG